MPWRIPRRGAHLFGEDSSLDRRHNLTVSGHDGFKNGFLGCEPFQFFFLLTKSDICSVFLFELSFVKIIFSDEILIMTSLNLIFLMLNLDFKREGPGTFLCTLEIVDRAQMFGHFVNIIKDANVVNSCVGCYKRFIY